jgi:hypothetical protein
VQCGVAQQQFAPREPPVRLPVRGLVARALRARRARALADQDQPGPGFADHHGARRRHAPARPSARRAARPGPDRPAQKGNARQHRSAARRSRPRRHQRDPDPSRGSGARWRPAGSSPRTRLLPGPAIASHPGAGTASPELRRSTSTANGTTGRPRNIGSVKTPTASSPRSAGPRARTVIRFREEWHQRWDRRRSTRPRGRCERSGDRPDRGARAGRCRRSGTCCTGPCRTP